MLVKVEDGTGQLTIYMREKAALSLSNIGSKEDFEAARAEEFLDFLKKASIKHRTQAVSDSGSGSAPDSD